MGLLDFDDLHILRGDENRVVAKKKKVKQYSCSDCGLNQSCKTPYMPVYGKGGKKILLLLDTPSQSEDIKGRPWVGSVGSLMKETLEEETGLNLEKDCFTAFAVQCAGKKKVNAIQISACRKRVFQIIEENDIEVIIPFGYWATMSLINDIILGEDVGKDSTTWNGEKIPCQRLKKWICPTFEISFTSIGERNENTPVIDAMCRVVKEASELVGTPVPIRDDESKIRIIKTVDEAIDVLKRIYQRPHSTIAFDYETTGIKPHRKGHKIVSVSLSNGKVAYAFPFFDDERFRKAWKRVMTAKNIRWIAHNAKYEWMWTRTIEGYFPRNFAGDTMLASHIHNSQKSKKLKTLTFQKFGVASYEGDVSPFLKTGTIEKEDYGDNGINSCCEAPLDSLLYYNALDSLYTFDLWKYYQEALDDKEIKAWAFFNRVLVAFAQAEYNGMRIDTSQGKQAEKELEQTMSDLLVSIRERVNKLGWNKDFAFRPSASDDIGYVMFTLLGITPEKKTAKGGNAVDKEVMQRADHPIINDVLEWKKLQKLKDTYLKGVIREAVDDLIHPFFNLHTVVSFRTSSNSPNFQNFPKRDKTVSKAIRSLLFPHKGQKLVEYDYKAIEVAINACYNKDPNLVKYVKDPSTDMHRDTGEEIFMYERGELPKFDRGIAKNKFVFPEFYGSWYKNVARDLWEYCSQETKDHLKSKGMKNFTQFEEHVRLMEESFWKKRFPVYDKWRKDTRKEFGRKGYTESYLGFKYHAPMDNKQVTNYQAQGGACHCLIWTFTNVNEIIQKFGLKSKLMGQIHDSAVVSVEPEEEELIDYLFYTIGTQKIVEEFPWIIVPLEIEKAVGEVDGSWYSIEEKGLLGKELPITEYEGYIGE